MRSRRRGYFDAVLCGGPEESLVAADGRDEAEQGRVVVGGATLVASVRQRDPSSRNVVRSTHMRRLVGCTYGRCAPRCFPRANYAAQVCCVPFRRAGALAWVGGRGGGRVSCGDAPGVAGPVRRGCWLRAANDQGQSSRGRRDVHLIAAWPRSTGLGPVSSPPFTPRWAEFRTARDRSDRPAMWCRTPSCSRSRTPR